MSAFRLNFQRKIIRARKGPFFGPSFLQRQILNRQKNPVTIMSTSSEKSYCFPEEIDMQEKSSEPKVDEKDEEMQKDKKKNLWCILVNKIYPENLRNWPIFNLLKPEFMSEFFPQIHMVMVYADRGNRAIIVTKDKGVYNLCYNEDDQSKIDNTHIALYPKKIEELCGKNIKTFAHGSYFLLALTEEGEVYSWSFKKCSRNQGFYASTPTRVAGLIDKHIVDIACGSYHSLALTSDGKVYAWGENDFGQVGNENTGIFDGKLPRQVKHELENKNVIRIACGSTFNMVVTDEYKLYGWGDNVNGQISIENSIFSTSSNQSDSIQNQKMFDSSFKSTTYNTFGNSLSSVPPLESKQVSFGAQSQWGSTSIFSAAPIMAITTTSPFSGPNVTHKNIPSNNLSTSTHHRYVYPHEITTIPDKIVEVACGHEHTLALTDKRKIYTWGTNGHLGVDKKKYFGPIMVNVSEMEIEDIAAYGYLSVAVDINKTIYIWGDYFGQNIINPLSTKFTRIHDAFAYSHFSVMHKPLIVSDTDDCEYVEKVLDIMESLGTAFDDPSTSDFIIQVEGKSIHVHKAILKIRCQYFKNKFQHHWTNNWNNQSMQDSSVYTVPDKFSYIVYKAFLKYLYTGKIDLPSENALELVKLADEYSETSLKRDCCQIIKQAITPSNVAFFYNKAIECNAETLEKFCFQFALRHMKEVVLSDDYLKLDMNTKDNLIREAAKANIFKT